MNRFGTSHARGPAPRGAILLLFMAALVFTTTGLSCGDVPFATSTFRDAALDQISSGVKSIVDGLIDGIFAVLEEAGDGGDSSSS